MKITLLASATLATLAVFATPMAQAVPADGNYVGVVRITKFLPFEGGLTTRTTNRVVARVISGGTLTIMSAVPQTLFAAFSTESTVIRGLLRGDGTCHINGPLFSPRAPADPSNPGEYRGTVVETTNGFTLRHENTPEGVAYFMQPPTTTFEYSFRRVTR